MIDIIICNKNNINERIDEHLELFCVVAVSNPFPDPIQYHDNNLMKGLLRLQFWDSDFKTCNDEAQLFNVQKKETFLNFIEDMISCGVRSVLIHCDKGRSRSVALGCSLVQYFGEDRFQILNWEDFYTPNLYVLSFF